MEKPARDRKPLTHSRSHSLIHVLLFGIAAHHRQREQTVHIYDMGYLCDGPGLGSDDH